MLILSINDLINAVIIGITCAVVCGPLQREGMAFHFWFRALQWIAEKVGNVVAKPLGYCAVCFCGQVCFWYYVFSHGFNLGLLASPCIGMLTIILLEQVGVYR